MAEPRASRPAFSEAYGINTDEEGLLAWERAREQLTRSRSYWIATTRPDGRPHAMPVWGVFVDDRVVFGTSRASRKARNLAERPDVVVHLESGDDVVVVEGVAEEVDDGSLLERVAEAYDEKYDWRPGMDDLVATAWYAVRPRVAHAWLERDFVRTATRYTFAE